MPNVSTDDFLAHYGVKGMKWGKRKSEGSSSSSSGPARLSRKEHRALVKTERAQFYQDKAQRLLKEAAKNDDVMISVKSFDTYPTVVTGREFTNYLSRGGVFDIRMTDVFATKNGDGNYELNDKFNVQYKKPKR